jgi:lysophospholipase L1-like esterase
MRQALCCSLFSVASAILLTELGVAQDSKQPSAPPQRPTLFLVGDSIMKTGTGNGATGPWGWGSEISPLFDEAKIQVMNEARGGRSSRGFIEEGHWAKIVDRLKPGDFVIVMFGHNDAANSKNYPDRISLKGSGDQTEEIASTQTGKKQTIHTYGWYVGQYARDAKAKGATAIICSPVPRNTWADGKIKRGFDGYSQWAQDAAKTHAALFIDLNALVCDRLDQLGQQKAKAYFADTQHTTKAGARLNAEAVIEGLKNLKVKALTSALKPSPH